MNSKEAAIKIGRENAKMYHDINGYIVDSASECIHSSEEMSKWKDLDMKVYLTGLMQETIGVPVLVNAIRRKLLERIIKERFNEATLSQ